MERIAHGDTGPVVADVQRRLLALGMRPDDEPGVYGDATRQAVREFQRDRRLTAHGDVDEDTWVALVDAGFALGDRLLYRTRPPLRGDDVRELQRSLSRLGFDVGGTDGVHGDQTDQGLRDFQHNAGLLVDGIAGSATLTLLSSLRRRHQHATTFEVLEDVTTGDGVGALVGQRIAIDPSNSLAGHPVIDGLRGRDVVDDVARRVVGALAARGASPVLTTFGPAGAERSGTDRARLANRLDVDAVVSIGCTAVAQPAAQGVIGHHFGDGVVTSRRGRELAMACVDTIASRTGALNCDVHPSTAALLRESRAPAVALEIGFLSNEGEARRLADPRHRQRIAGAIADAIHAWVEHSPDR